MRGERLTRMHYCPVFYNCAFPSFCQYLLLDILQGIWERATQSLFLWCIVEGIPSSNSSKWDTPCWSWSPPLKTGQATKMVAGCSYFPECIWSPLPTFLKYTWVCILVFLEYTWVYLLPSQNVPEYGFLLPRMYLSSFPAIPKVHLCIYSSLANWIVPPRSCQTPSYFPSLDPQNGSAYTGHWCLCPV